MVVAHDGLLTWDEIDDLRDCYRRGWHWRGYAITSVDFGEDRQIGRIVKVYARR